MSAPDLFGGSRPLPTLSLWEPWASLIVAGVKVHETRHWPTHVRGPIAIHAAKRCERRVDDALDFLCVHALGVDWASTRPAGAVVAIATLAGCNAAPETERWTPQSDQVAGNFAAGRWAFALRDVRPLREPISLVGRQGFFRWLPPPDLETRLTPTVDQVSACEAFDRRLARRGGA